MKILVTGGCGYLGRNLISLLADSLKCEIICLDIEGSDISTVSDKASAIELLPRNWSYNDIRDLICKHQPEAIFHLAALVRVQDENAQLPDLINSNITLGSYLLASAANTRLKYFVNTGSFWEERLEAGYYAPVNAYAATKRAFQAMLEYYVDLYQLSAINLKLFGIFGPDDNRPNLLTALMNFADQGDVFKTTPGQQILDMVYVKDAARAFICALKTLTESKPGLLPDVEISSGEHLKLEQFLELYNRLAVKKVKYELGALDYRPREVMNRKADIENTNKTIGWSPEVSIKAGLEIILAERANHEKN